MAWPVGHAGLDVPLSVAYHTALPLAPPSPNPTMISFLSVPPNHHPQNVDRAPPMYY